MGNFYNYIREKTKDRGTSWATAAPVFIVASIFVAWTLVSRARKRKVLKRYPSRSTTIAALHGGQLALRKFAYYRENRENAESLQNAEAELQDLLNEENPDYELLQRTVTKLEMSGKEEEAVEMLENGVKAHQNRNRKQEVYEIEMLLVEMLIYKGDFERAFKYRCLQQEGISDARRPLYKSIIYIMLGRPEEEAKKCWDEFKEIQELHVVHTVDDTQVDHSISSFNEFKEAVTVLKEHIQKAKAKKIQK